MVIKYLRYKNEIIEEEKQVKEAEVYCENKEYIWDIKKKNRDQKNRIKMDWKKKYDSVMSELESRNRQNLYWHRIHDIPGIQRICWPIKVTSLFNDSRMSKREPSQRKLLLRKRFKEQFCK